MSMMSSPCSKNRLTGNASAFVRIRADIGGH
jgi:hypothetical protein